MIGPLLAIIQDTWRQSIHQWVLIILIAMLGMLAFSIVAIPEVRTKPDGTDYLANRFDRDMKQTGLEVGWEGIYADALKDELGYDEELKKRNEELNQVLDDMERVDYEISVLRADDPDNPKINDLIDTRRELARERDRRDRDNFEMRKFVREEVDREIEKRTADISKLERGVEFWLSESATAIFMLSMLGFIAACSVYIPNMLEQGSVDLVLSKPIRRWQIYFGKYVGGLVLYSAAVLAAYIFTFVGIGFVSGVWHWAYFGALPMTIFALALLYSIIAWVGLWTRSTAMAMVVGYVYYLVIDSVIGHIGDMPFIGELPLLEKWAKFLEYTFPSFVWLREAADAAVLSVNVFPWHHVVVGVIWLVICLGTAYNRFRINDY